MIDLSSWDELLREYVNDQGQVDYARWQDHSFSDLAHCLEAWLETLRGADFSPNSPQLTQAAALAILLNLYNALTIQQVLTQYPIPSIRPTFLGIPNWIGFLQFFTKPLFTLEGQPASLNHIEHGLLRQRFTEPRIHFALVCAARGCPLLRNGAYYPETVQEQLETDARRFIRNPDKVRYDTTQKILYCSQIFKWYQQDFLKVAPSVPAYIQPYFPDHLETDAIALRYLSYDWTLNQ